MTCPFVKKNGAVCGKPSKDGDFCGNHSPEGRLKHAKARIGKPNGRARKTVLSDSVISIPTKGKPLTYDQLALVAWEFFRTGAGFSAQMRSAFLGMLQSITNRDAHAVALIRARAEDRASRVPVTIQVRDVSQPPIEPPHE